jgi:SAM-dependent methyltransferase
MKPTTADDVLDIVNATFPSAALGAALELGLFWLLEPRPMDGPAVARALGIPPRRCSYWLQMLCRLGLVEEDPGGYRPTATARRAILDVHSRDTWALLAEEAREPLPILRDFPAHLRRSGSAWAAVGLTQPMYVDQMARDPERARRFTRMLYELHQPLAEALAGTLDLSAAARLLDLGGGSGVISLALLRRYPELTATVVDIAHVCSAGREIAAEGALGDRITYRQADLLRDELPSGFDVVLECDVNVYSDALFRKVRDALNPDGRFIIVDELAPAEGVAPPSRLHWALAGSLTSPSFEYPTAGQIRDLLETAGLRVLAQDSLVSATGQGRSASEGFVVIEARRRR